MAFNPPVVDDFNRAALGANYTTLAGTATCANPTATKILFAVIAAASAPA